MLILGLGRSGQSAANFCAQRGARVFAADERAHSDKDLALSADIEVRLGQPFPDPALFDLVVPSPGVPAERYRASARRVWGDIELAGRALPVPIIAVTGTNGKSTTVMLIEAMLKACGLRACAAGNLGNPALSLLGQALDVAVLEVSSFQLESVDGFRPHVAVILNLSPDHMDRHGDMEGYAAAKKRILERQGPDDIAVLNEDDARVRQFADDAQARVLSFSHFAGTPDKTRDARVWLDLNHAVLSEGGKQTRLSLDGASTLGEANRDNILAALAAVWAFGADPERALDALVGFKLLAHRSEHIATRRGVRFINDSKATNPGAAQRALESATSPVLWIAGGRDKGLSFRTLAEAARGRVRTALLIGEAADKIESELAGIVPCQRMASLEDAVARAAELAQEGDDVLLAPACASFDQFKNFETRGDCFRKAVLQMPEGNLE
ncbi:MAG: UDP-N-acetylmuramoyl-L-alanine--D-glutamate ligase [Myxococcota bacterium]|nr:UDP-N-acetylmuramoyl-L-alanine--D-glutamate ligase [Myxococcota bacterium]